MFANDLLKKTMTLLIIITVLISTCQPACAAHEAAVIEQEMNIIVRANELDEGDIIVRANSADGEETTTESHEPEEPTAEFVTEEPATEEPTSPPAGEEPSGAESGEEPTVNPSDEPTVGDEPAAEEPSEILPWSSKAVGAEYSLAHNAKGSGVKVAVLDSGLDIYSEVTASGGIDLVDPEYCHGDDLTGHGTAIAGIIAAPEDNAGIIGIAPEAEIYVVRVLDGENAAPVSRIIEGIDWCIENDMDIINMSFGTDQNPQILHEKIMEATNAGIILVSSAGNSTALQYPAKYDEVIAVSSVDSAMKKSSFSAWGKGLNFVAPGENIYSTSLIGGYGVCSGTSMASPHITAAAAVLLGQDKTKSPEFIQALLAASCKKFGNAQKYGNGLPDLEFALQNYDSFAPKHSHKPNNHPKNNKKPVKYEAEDVFVEGMWSTQGHNLIAEDTTNLKQISIIKEISLSCDNYKNEFNHDEKIKTQKGTAYSGSLCYHGTGNYVATARFLYTLARHYKNGVPFSKSEQEEYDSLLGSNNSNRVNSNNRHDILFDIEKIYPKYSNLIISISNNENEIRATIILGMLFHLLGDIYAHRSIVPPSSAKNREATKHGSGEGGNEGLYFVISDFNDDCNNHIMTSVLKTTEEKKKKHVDRDLIISLVTKFFYSLFVPSNLKNAIDNLTRALFCLIFKLPYSEKILETTFFSSEQQEQIDKTLLVLAANIPGNSKQLCKESDIDLSQKPCVGAMLRIAELGVLQFKDIKYFLNGYDQNTNEAKSNHTYYEDQALGNDFYRRRFDISKAVVQKFINDYNSNAAFQPENFLPIYTDSMCKYYWKTDLLVQYLSETNDKLDSTKNKIFLYSYWEKRTDYILNYSTWMEGDTYVIYPWCYSSTDQPYYSSRCFP